MLSVGKFNTPIASLFFLRPHQCLNSKISSQIQSQLQKSRSATAVEASFASSFGAIKFPMPSLDSIFLSGLGLIYFFAIFSFYVQYPGLVSSNGLLPADIWVKHLQSQNINSIVLGFHAERLGVSVDALNEFLFCVSIPSSIFVFLGFHQKFLFAMLWIIYLHFRTIGQTFMSFQWDILLLETGFLAILSSPWLFRTKSRPTFNWCYRFLIFKLMFLSGVVKLQAQCPSWEKLTALEYHFATQCIPNPLAWFAHQLPPVFLRASVAATLLIEIPLTVCLISPLLRVRRFGCALQWLLQATIIASGNYNFFNLLTILLALKSWESDDDAPSNTPPSIATYDAPSGGAPKGKPKAIYDHVNTLSVRELKDAILARGGDAERCLGKEELQDRLLMLLSQMQNPELQYHHSLHGDAVARIPPSRGNIVWSRVLDVQGPFVAYLTAIRDIDQRGGLVPLWMQWLVCVGLTGASMALFLKVPSDAFNDELQWWRGEFVQLKVAWVEVQAWLQPVCLGSVVCVLVHVACHWVLRISEALSWSRPPPASSFFSPLFKGIAALITVWNVAYEVVVGCVCVGWVLLASAPFNTLCDMSAVIPPLVAQWANTAQRFSIVSAYGLFRRMTGMGSLSKDELAHVRWSVGGSAAGRARFTPSVVARPEIVLEGLHPTTNTWVEIPFRYKPVSVFEAPPFVAPLQPRLDWQMWFAALGSYDREPWLINLVYKLLHHPPIRNSDGKSEKEEKKKTKKSKKSKKSRAASTSSSALNLLDADRYPFKDAPPVAIRATLYDYDFTRLDSPWNRLLPNAEMVPPLAITLENVRAGLGWHQNITSSSPTSPSGAKSGSHSESESRVAWWYRRNPRDYLPAIEANNPSVVQYLQSFGIDPRPQDSTLEAQFQSCMRLQQGRQPFGTAQEAAAMRVLATWLRWEALGNFSVLDAAAGAVGQAACSSLLLRHPRYESRFELAGRPIRSPMLANVSIALVMGYLSFKVLVNRLGRWK